ncbi:MAG: GNAT family N-acetyltransferase [Proteobacteria bacterium]|nr:GNAT family N-acetyltransferase [Pseudomonadota bacterium]
MPLTQIRLARSSDLNELDVLVAAYHQFEGITLALETRKRGITQLMESNELGRIWLIEVDELVVGYIAVCFGYGLEFAGRDAFIDEFFISENYRGQGLGSNVLELVAREVSQLNFAALHLEVAKSNVRAARLYAAAGFEARAKYRLMTRKLTE